jgi:cytoskeleton protein RodZ
MSETAQALGQKLKTERERRGLSAQKMADDMHLDAWVIDALETGEYERIGPAVYARGHLRKYASILGVAAAAAAPTRETPPAGGPTLPAPIIRLGPPGGGGSMWPIVGAFAVIALVAGGIVWWRPWHGARAAAGTAGAPLAASVVGPPSASASEPIGAGSSATQPAGDAANGDQSIADEAAGGAGVGAAAAAARAATPAGSSELTPGVGRARLRLSFSADSRVAVYDYTGRPVFTGNGRANSVKTVSGMAPFRVYLGFASGVQLQVNDRAVAIGPQFVSGDVARFEAGADGVLRRDPRPMPAGTTAPMPAAPMPAAPMPAAPRG